MDKIFRITLLGNTTTEYTGNEIRKECAAYGIEAVIYNAPYQQYNQEILDLQSGMYRSKPDLIILSLEGLVLFPHWYETETMMAEPSAREAQVRDVTETLAGLLDTLLKQSEARILVHNFRVPYHTPMGILDSKTPFALKRMITTLNLGLEDYAAGKNRVHVFDYDGFCAHTGQCDPRDHKMFYLTRTALPYPAVKLAAREYLRIILPLNALVRKCLVLDLDNTLWGGIAGEDGLSGVSLDISGPGRSFYDFQREILNLYHKGVLLAINSKNNPEDVLEILEKHPHMLLRKSYFACMKINWEEKSSNLREIARELNIGLDSLVFFDDNPVEREFVKVALPQVAVVDVPDDVCKYCSALRELVEFESLALTEEDIRRNELYKQNAEHLELQQKSTGREEYLAGLQTKMVVAYMDKFSLPRIAQLTQKTNQFNMTTKRYQAADIEKMVQEGTHAVFCCSVSDRFGDSGIVGCCIAEMGSGTAHMDTFLLSCRVLGRDIEYAFLSAVVGLLRDKGCERITARYIRTEKNGANRDFYLKAGFTPGEEQEGAVTYTLAEDAAPVGGKHIHTVLKEHVEK